MKQKYFSKLENKYYYGISRTFWHFFTAIAVVCFVVGVVMIGWSYIPPSKETVTKATPPAKEIYPSQAEVNINDILDVLPKDKKKVKEQLEKAKEEIYIPTQMPNQKKERDTAGLKVFERQIAYMKNILPYREFTKLWNGEGYYTYPHGEAKYKVTKNEAYRKFVSTQRGLIEQIESRTDQFGFKSYKEKAKLVERYNNILKTIDLKNRNRIVMSLINFKNKDFEKTIHSLESLNDILPLFNQEDIIRAFNSYVKFIKNNPNDGVPLIVFEKEILPKFSKPERHLASNMIKSEYINYYNNSLNGLKENTLNFIPFLNKIDVNKQAVALSYYYKIYRSKNSERLVQIQNIEDEHNRKIASIDTEFAKAKMEAEANHLIKKEKKSFWRSKSIQGIGVALGTILIITVILLLLSMIRNVNKLAEAMLENNAQKNK